MHQAQQPNVHTARSEAMDCCAAMVLAKTALGSCKAVPCHCDKGSERVLFAKAIDAVLAE